MLAGRVVIVTGGATGIGRDLVFGLNGMGAVVSIIDDPINSPGEADLAFFNAAGSARVDAVVHALVDPDALVSAPLESMDESAWDRRCEAVLRTALWCAHGAYGVLASEGGRIVFVTPTIGLTGMAGLAPYATAVEGVRSLAKSAARQWRHQGITVNCVAPSVDAMGGGKSAEVAAVVGMLLAEKTGAVTGGTLVVDGGIVMAP